MRIAIVIHSLGGGGAERVTAILARHWVSAGYNVKIITLMGTTDDFYELDSAIERESLHLAEPSKNMFRAIVANLRRIVRLRRSLTNFDADIAVGMMAISSALVAFSGIGRPWVSIGAERNYPPLDPLGRSWKIIRRLSYRFLDAIVVQTTDTAEWISTQTSTGVRIIPNPLSWPLEAEEPVVTTTLISPGRSIILAVGRLAPQKGFSRLIEAFSLLHADYPHWDLVIVGSGPDKHLLETRCDQLGLHGRVLFPGRVGNIGDWYKRASIFAMTSLFEGFPNALLEAMAYGLPVISTDCDTGPRDLIVNHVSGVLVAQGDQSALVAGLRGLLESESTRASLSEKAREVIKRYATERISGQWLDLFHEMCRRKHLPNISSAGT